MKKIIILKTIAIIVFMNLLFSFSAKSAEGDILYSATFTSVSAYSYALNKNITIDQKNWTISSSQQNGGVFYLGCNSGNSAKGILGGTATVNPNSNGFWDDVIDAWILEDDMASNSVQAYALMFDNAYDNVGEVTLSWSGGNNVFQVYLFGDKGDNNGLVLLNHTNYAISGTDEHGEVKYTTSIAENFTRFAIVARPGTSTTTTTNKTIRISNFLIKEGSSILTCDSSPTMGLLNTEAINSSSIYSLSTISNIGDCPITEYGFVYSPTNTTPEIGGAGVTIHVVGTSYTQSDDIEATISDLSPNTMYYIRSYAINGAGISYSSVETETTLSPAIYTITFNDAVAETTTYVQNCTEGQSINLPAGSTCTNPEWVFAGWSEIFVYETTVEPTTYLSGETYYPTANCALYAVYNKSENIENIIEDNLTINTSDFNGTSYDANNGPHTKSSSIGNNISYYTNQIMLQSSNIQWQKDNSYFYNITDLNNITTVEISSASNNLTIYEGNTERPSSGTIITPTVNGNIYTYTLSENNGFIYIKNGALSTTTTLYIKISFTNNIILETITYNSNPTCAPCIVTPTMDIVITDNPTSSSIDLFSSISDIGGCDITEYGFVYSSVDPDPVIGEENVEKVIVGTTYNTTEDDIEATITDLLPNTTYHIRSYAINEAGTAYSSVETGETLELATYTITFYDEAAAIATFTQNCTEGQTINLPAGSTCTNPDWIFAGWAETLVTETSNPLTLYTANYAYYPETNITLYAVYSKKSNSNKYGLTTSIIPREYVIGAIIGTAGLNNNIAAINNTISENWLKYTIVTPVSDTIVMNDTSHVWVLETNGTGFSLKNKKSEEYLILNSRTGSGSISFSSTAGAIYASIVNETQSTFEVHQSSTATAISGNQLACNLGSTYGYRMYNQRNHETGTTGITTQVRFFKKNAYIYSSTPNCPAPEMQYGDLAIVAVNTNTSENYSEISVVTFSDIIPRTNIDFTDNGYEKEYAGKWGNTEGVIRLTRIGESIPAGSIITFSGNNNNITPILDINFDVYVNGINDNDNWNIVSLNTNKTFKLDSGDQVWIMNGGEWENDSEVDNAGYDGTVLYGWTATGWENAVGYGSETGSAIHPDARCATTNVEELANNNKVKYTGNLTSATRTEWIGRINDPDNWTGFADDGDFYDADPKYKNENVQFSVIEGGLVAGKWAGFKSSGWCDCSNWWNLEVPDENTDVEIPADTYENRNMLVLSSHQDSVAYCANLKISGSIGNQENAKIYISQDLEITDEATINFGTNNIEAYIGGDITISENCNFNSSKLNLILNGSDIQNITTEGNSLSDITFDNQNGFIIHDNMTITKNAVFTNGILNYNSSDIFVTFEDQATSGGCSENSFINGKVAKKGYSNFIFPIGDVQYRTLCTTLGPQTYKVFGGLEITPLSDDEELTIFADYNFSNDGMPQYWSSSPNLEESIHHVSDREHWLLSSNSNVDMFIGFHWTNNDQCLTYGATACVHGFCELENPSAVGTDDILSNLTVVVHQNNKWVNIGYDASGSSLHHDEGYIISYDPISLQGAAKSSETIVSVGSTDAILPLPVELISFKAVCENNNASITWQTASEINNNYFILERSDDMVDFKEIGKIYGNGNSNSLNEYNFTDITPLKGTTYYRLKQVDYDGAIVIYNAVNIDCSTNEETSISIFPNPFANEININLNNINDEHFIIELYDELGKQVYINKFTNESSNSTLKLNLNDLKPGIYNLKITLSNDILNKRIIKY
ncbi:MAG: T9SS type A sorting domain-containing protein [Bacteroidales bacterium]|jgi:hypothetical protein|nr:T9SS type A sorting domain-containing protein [Bacteroidales bacterium]